MLKVGLTGGIGSGKSTVCQFFADLGVPIIDADVIARHLVEPGQSALQEIIKTFGNAMVNPEGDLNRAALGALIFADSTAKQQLESIMHPLVYAEINAQVSRLHASYCLIAVPLLFETQKKQAFDRILVVDCPVATQILRVTTRDRISNEQALAIINSQIDRQERLAAADDIIDNSTTPAQLAEHVKSLHNLYLLLASTRKSSA